MITDQIPFILFLQALFVQSTEFMKFFSFLGSEEFYLIVIPILYWCVDSYLAIRTIIFLLIGDSVKTILKILFHQPRPFWIDSRVKAHVLHTDFAMPSGHSLNAAIVFGNFATYTRKHILQIGYVLVIILIGLSRIILGVHFPTDVLFGWIFGAILLYVFITLEPKVINWFQNKSYSTWIYTSFIFSILLIITGWLFQIGLWDWIIPTEWSANIVSQYTLVEPINPFSISSLVSNAGVFFGLVCGLIFIKSRGGFSPQGSPLSKVLRFILGITIAAAIWIGLGALLPKGDTIIAFIFRYARYFLIGVWIAGIAPYLFVRLQLAHKNSDLIS